MSSVPNSIRTWLSSILKVLHHWDESVLKIGLSGFQTVEHIYIFCKRFLRPREKFKISNSFVDTWSGDDIEKF